MQKARQTIGERYVLHDRNRRLRTPAGWPASHRLRCDLRKADRRIAGTVSLSQPRPSPGGVASTGRAHHPAIREPRIYRCDPLSAFEPVRLNTPAAHGRLDVLDQDCRLYGDHQHPFNSGRDGTVHLFAITASGESQDGNFGISTRPQPTYELRSIHARQIKITCDQADPGAQILDLGYRRQTIDTVDKLAKWRTVKISDFDFARDGWLQKASVRAQAAPGRKFGLFDRSLRLKNAWCGSVGKKFQAEFSRPSLSTVSITCRQDLIGTEFQEYPFQDPPNVGRVFDDKNAPAGKVVV